LKQVAIALLVLCSLAASAETLRGVVRNGTSNKPSAGDEVTLKSMTGGMEDVAHTKTNAKGEFTFKTPGGQQPYLIWVEHQGVTYTRRYQPGDSGVAVQVFDSAPKLNEVALAEHMTILQTTGNNDTLRVDELYTVSNTSVPPKAQAGSRTFELYLPEGAKLEDAGAQTAGGMPIKASPTPDPQEKNKYSFDYPIRPGQTRFTVTYALPYSGKMSFTPKTTLPVKNALVVTPASMNFSAANQGAYSPTNDPQIKNVNMYVASNISDGQQVSFQIEGTGALPRDQADASAGQGGGGEAQGQPPRPGGGLGTPNAKPDPLHNGQWMFLGVLTLFLAAGAIYVYTATPPAAAAEAGATAKPKDRKGMLLEAMKEEIFQLESERIQGKISTQEYEAAKSALDKTLQRAVKREAAAK
jgi:hypothetical protein